jgi:hypothetical protein
VAHRRTSQARADFWHPTPPTAVPPSGTTGTAPSVPSTVTETSGGASPVAAVGATRFHATKEIDPTRAVRDIGVISDEVLTALSAAGVQVRITVDIESADLGRLAPHQVTVLKENLATLGFTDWNVE